MADPRVPAPAASPDEPSDRETLIPVIAALRLRIAQCGNALDAWLDVVRPEAATTVTVVRDDLWRALDIGRGLRAASPSSRPPEAERDAEWLEALAAMKFNTAVFDAERRTAERLHSIAARLRGSARPGAGPELQEAARRMLDAWDTAGFLATDDHWEGAVKSVSAAASRLRALLAGSPQGKAEQ